jgi:hypothetical protein
VTFAVKGVRNNSTVSIQPLELAVQPADQAVEVREQEAA